MYRGNDRDDIVELVSRVLDYRNFNELNFKSRVFGYLSTKKKRKSVSGYPLAIRSFDRRERRDRGVQKLSKYWYRARISCM